MLFQVLLVGWVEARQYTRPRFALNVLCWPRRWPVLGPIAEWEQSRQPAARGVRRLSVAACPAEQPPTAGEPDVQSAKNKRIDGTVCVHQDLRGYQEMARERGVSGLRIEVFPNPNQMVGKHASGKCCHRSGEDPDDAYVPPGALPPFVAASAAPQYVVFRVDVLIEFHTDPRICHRDPKYG